jgi:hypothetical protein
MRRLPARIRFGRDTATALSPPAAAASGVGIYRVARAAPGTGRARSVAGRWFGLVRPSDMILGSGHPADPHSCASGQKPGQLVTRRDVSLLAASWFFFSFSFRAHVRGLVVILLQALVLPSMSRGKPMIRVGVEHVPTFLACLRPTCLDSAFRAARVGI